MIRPEFAVEIAFWEVEVRLLEAKARYQRNHEGRADPAILVALRSARRYLDHVSYPRIGHEVAHCADRSIA